MEKEYKDYEKYEDILYMKRPVSKKHIPMDRKKRAAQFASFAALKGYDEKIKETSDAVARR